MVAELRREKPSVKVGLVGKYVELHDAYLSVREALNHAALYYGVSVDLQWIPSTDVERNDGKQLLTDLDAIIVPGGFGSRGVEGKVLTAQHARENKVPYLGICLGLQVMMIDFARNVLNLKNADSYEFDKLTPDPVINLMLDQRGLDQLGGTMRRVFTPAKFCLVAKRLSYTRQILSTNATVTATNSTMTTASNLKTRAWYFRASHRMASWWRWRN